MTLHQPTSHVHAQEIVNDIPIGEGIAFERLANPRWYIRQPNGEFRCENRRVMPSDVIYWMRTYTWQLSSDQSEFIKLLREVT